MLINKNKSSKIIIVEVLKMGITDSKITCWTNEFTDTLSPEILQGDDFNKVIHKLMEKFFPKELINICCDFCDERLKIFPFTKRPPKFYEQEWIASIYYFLINSYEKECLTDYYECIDNNYFSHRQSNISIMSKNGILQFESSKDQHGNVTYEVNFSGCNGDILIGTGINKLVNYSECKEKIINYIRKVVSDQFEIKIITSDLGFTGYVSEFMKQQFTFNCLDFNIVDVYASNRDIFSSNFYFIFVAKC